MQRKREGKAVKIYQENDFYMIRDSISEIQQETFQHGDSRFPCASYLDQYCSGREAYPWHWHDDWEIAYVEQGAVRVCVNDQQVLLQEGDGIFINRRVLHTFSMAGKTEVRMPNILFDPVLLYGSRESVYWEKYVKPLALSKGFTHEVFRRQAPWQAEILGQAERAFSLLTAEDYGYELRVRAALSEIFLILTRHIPDLGNTEAKSQTEMDRIRQMLSFIQLRYTEPVSVQQIADSAFISRRECMRSFQRILGTSPIQYVIDLRLRKAKQLLLETDFPVMEIGARCGFPDQSYFTRVFREKTGVSPGKFRKSR